MDLDTLSVRCDLNDKNMYIAKWNIKNRPNVWIEVWALLRHKQEAIEMVIKEYKLVQKRNKKKFTVILQQYVPSQEPLRF